MLTGFKGLAAAATALSVGETDETSALAPALNWEGPPRQSSSCGAGAHCSPLPPAAAGAKASGTDERLRKPGLFQIAWF